MKMILVIALICASSISFAQTDPLRVKLDSIFQYVDKSQIPTGYLREYGSEFLPLEVFNGVLTDSNKVDNLDTWRTAYADLSSSRIQGWLPAMPPLSGINTNIKSARSNGSTALAILLGKYASLKQSSLNDNLFTVNNDQLFDVWGRPSSPYINNNLLLISPIEKKYKDTVVLSFDPAFYYSNTSLSIAGLSVDFHDGSGYQQISVSGINKTYSDSSGNKIIDFKVVASNGEIFFCHSAIYVEVSAASSNRYADSDPLAKEITISSLTPASGVYNNIQDKLQIRYSVNNPTRNNSNPNLRFIRKPLIYVEGYDVGGDYDIHNLIRVDVNNPKENGEWIALAALPGGAGYDFMHDLDDIGSYDLIFVNYNTLRSIPTNASMLQEVVKWVNAQKALSGSTEKNIVLGVSAGGLVARYCLANMTKNIGYNSTDTRLLITHDSPHQGANVPLAFQHFLYNLAYTSVLGNQVKDKIETLQDFIDLNTAPATAQLLRARVIDQNNNVELNTFLAGPSSPYQQMVNLPANQRPYKFIATAQGSQCGIPVINESNVVLAAQGAEFTSIKVLGYAFRKKYWLTTSMRSLPRNGQALIEDYKMEARIKILGIGGGWHDVKTDSHLNPPGFNNWDDAPGSTQSISSRTQGALSTGLLPIRDHTFYALHYPINIPEPWIIIDGGLSLNVYHDLFSFVSTTSALDAADNISPYTPFNYAMYGATNTRVDKYIAQEFYQGAYNLNHTDYSPRNAKWIYNEMQNINNSFSCKDQCPSNTGYSISGPALICTNGTYSLNNAGPGIAVNWTVSQNSNIVALTTSGNNATLQFSGISSGYVTLYAIPAVTGCTAPPPIFKQIYAGIPQSVTGLSSSVIAVHCTSSGNLLTVIGGAGASTYNWYTDYLSVPGYVFRRAGSTSRDTWLTSPNDCAEIGNLKIESINTCGSATVPYIQQIGDLCYPRQIEGCIYPPRPGTVAECPGCKSAGITDSVGVTINPNPAKDLIIIEMKYLDNRKATLRSLTEDLGIKKIIITNAVGNIVLSQNSTGSNKTGINIYRLITGTYKLSVFNGKQWISTTLIKR